MGISHLSNSAESKCCVLIGRALLLALDPHPERFSLRLGPSYFITLAQCLILSKIYKPRQQTALQQILRGMFVKIGSYYVAQTGLQFAVLLCEPPKC